MCRPQLNVSLSASCPLAQQQQEQRVIELQVAEAERGREERGGRRVSAELIGLNTTREGASERSEVNGEYK